MIKILLAEDDVDLGNVLSHFLKASGYSVTLANDGLEAFSIYKEFRPDICLLDVMMPGMDGFTLASKIKKENNDIPIVFLTAKNQKEDRITGLKLGGDDYITKPFEVEELLLRIKNILRRVGDQMPEILRINNVSLVQNKLSTSKKEYRLTHKEAELIQLLYANKNKILKREEILKELWGEDDYFMGRSMDVFMSRIRKYFAGDPNISLETVRGIGYIFNVK